MYYLKLCYKICKLLVWLKPFLRVINELGCIQMSKSSVYFIKFLKLKITFTTKHSPSKFLVRKEYFIIYMEH